MTKMDKIIREYLITIGFNNLYKSKEKNELVLDNFVDIIINDDINEWSTLFNEYEIRDIQMIMRDYKINEILHTKN